MGFEGQGRRRMGGEIIKKFIFFFGDSQLNLEMLAKVLVVIAEIVAA